MDEQGTAAEGELPCYPTSMQTVVLGCLRRKPALYLRAACMVALLCPACAGHGGSPSPSASGPGTARPNKTKPPPSDPVVAWLDRELVPLGPRDSLEPLASLLGGRAVVAMGEATHGTKEFFDLKHRIFRYLVERHRFVTLAMEMAPGPGAAVDAYLQTGKGDAAELVRGSYFFFEAEEIVSMLRWMRRHNETAATKVRFVGIDLTDVQKGIVDRNCADRKGCRVVMRDGFMSENALAAGKGTFLWAHNGHIAHFEAKDGWLPMGHYLRKELGADYYAVALEFSEGGFIAPAGGALPVLRTRAIEHLAGRQVAEYALPPAPPEALSHRFAQARAEVFFVDLSRSSEAARALFEGNRKLQSYGAEPPRAGRQYEEYAPLHEAFDGVVFVRRTHGYTFPR